MTTSNTLRTGIQRIGLIIAAVAAVLTVLFTPQFVQAQGRGSETESRRPGDGEEREFLAAALGITVEELDAAHEAAKEDAETSDLNRDELLAAELGITVDALEAAINEAHAAALAQAVAEGRLTEEEAALIAAQHNLKEFVDREALVASALGITVEELEAAHEAGQDLRDLLAELGIDHDTFKENLDTAYAEAVQQAVDTGVVTQEEADAILAGEVGHGRRGGEDGEGGRGTHPPRPRPDEAGGEDDADDEGDVNRRPQREERPVGGNGGGAGGPGARRQG